MQGLDTTIKCLGTGLNCVDLVFSLVMAERDWVEPEPTKAESDVMSKVRKSRGAVGPGN